MAGYQTIQALRPILHRGPVPTPVVNRDLVKGAPKKPVRGARKRGEPLPALLIAEIIRRREAHETIGTIEKALNVSSSSVRKFTAHVQPPPGGWPDCYASGSREPAVKNVEFAKRLRRAGFSFAEIGEELGCSRTAAIRAVRGPGRECNGRGQAITRWVQRASAASGISCKDIRKSDFSDRRRSGEVSKARHITFWLIRTYCGLSFPIIGGSLGGYDHTTVMSGFAGADKAAKHFGITKDFRPLVAARALWAADWREVGK